MGKRIYLGIIYGITAICIIIGTIRNLCNISIFNNNNYIFSHNKNTCNYNDDLSSFKNIDLDVAFGNVTITNGSSFNISYNGNNEYQPEYSVSNNTLKVTQKNEKNNIVGIHFSSTKCELTITVPSNTTLNNVSSEINAGNLTISGIKGSEITADLDMGNLTLSDCEFKKNNIEVNMGNVEFNQCDYENVSLDVDMGNASIKTHHSDNCGYSLNTDLGNIEFFGSNYKGSYNTNTSAHKMITADVNMGNITISQ